MLKPYKEGREYTTPVKGKADLYYTLHYEKSDGWIVGSMKKYPKIKRYGGAEIKFDFIDACYLGFDYKKAWNFFTGVLAGKKMRCPNSI